MGPQLTGLALGKMEKDGLAMEFLSLFPFNA